MLKHLIKLGLVALAFNAYAQTPVIDFDNFTPLVSSGILPDEVQMTGKDFMSTTRKNLSKGGSKKDKKSKETFVLESSYAIKEIFISGKLLYNDPISDYIEKVRLEVTAYEPDLRENTKVFLIKSSVVNAFATNQGYIFITTGMMSQLENEAQLAFILCHELVHFKKKHALKSYVESKKIERGDGAYRKSDIDEKYLAKANFSKEQETEADETGFDIFVKTKYALPSINQVFDVLKYSELPFEQIEFKASKHLETEHLKFPIDYIKETVDMPEEEETEDNEDKYSTHPNLKKRVASIDEKLGTLSETEKNDRLEYLVSEKLFDQAVKLARFDLCHTNLIDTEYDQAFYNAYVLLEENPNSIYLKKIMLRALYGLSKYKNAKRTSEVLIKPKKVKGESQRANFLFDAMDASEMNVVTLNYAWRLKKELRSDDVEVNLITDDVFYELVKKHYPDRSKFSTTPRETPLDTARSKEFEKTVLGEEDKKDSKTSSKKEEQSSVTKKKTTKSSKLKKKKKEGDKDYFITYAFVDLLKDPDFTAQYDRLKKEAKADKSAEKKESARRKNIKRKENIEVNEDDEPEENQYLLDEKEVAKKYNFKDDCYALGVDNIVVFNPFYLQIDERKKVPVQYASTEESKEKFNKKITQLSDKINLDINIIDKNEITTSDTEKYNELALIIDWLDERIDHNKLKMIPTDYLQIDNFTKKYGTEYLSLMGVISFLQKRSWLTPIVLFFVLSPLSLAVTVPMTLLGKDYTTYAYTVVYNLKTGQPEMVKVGQTQKRDANDILNGFFYDYLKQIKREGAKRNK